MDPCSFHARRISMSCYFIKGRGWKYDLILNKRRYTRKYFKTKAEAREAEARRREKRLVPRFGAMMACTGVLALLVQERASYVEIRLVPEEGIEPSWAQGPRDFESMASELPIALI